MAATKAKKELPTWLVPLLLGMMVVAVIVTLVLSPKEITAEEEAEVEPERALCVVCVDAGHGGADQGASSGDRIEKEDTLAQALALKAALERENIYVVMTRSEDTGLTLEERVAIAEQESADYFISLHRNISEEDAQGVEIWVAENCSETTRDLAQRVDDALVEVGVSADRGVRVGTQSGSGSYYVLRQTSMPAILIEMGFLQDSEDNELFDKYLEEYAWAIAQAVAAAASQDRAD